MGVAARNLAAYSSGDWYRRRSARDGSNMRGVTARGQHRLIPGSGRPAPRTTARSLLALRRPIGDLRVVPRISDHEREGRRELVAAVRGRIIYPGPGVLPSSRSSVPMRSSPGSSSSSRRNGSDQADTPGLSWLRPPAWTTSQAPRAGRGRGPLRIAPWGLRPGTLPNIPRVTAIAGDRPGMGQICAG